MLLFRPPLMTFGRPGVVPAAFAAPSPLADDQPGIADRASAQWIWTLLTPLPSSGTTTVSDLGAYALTGAATGQHTQAYRGFVMPLAGAPIVYESTVVTGEAIIPAPVIASVSVGPVAGRSVTVTVTPDAASGPITSVVIGIEAAGNGAVTQAPRAATLTAGNWVATFANVPDGTYAAPSALATGPSGVDSEVAGAGFNLMSIDGEAPAALMYGAVSISVNSIPPNESFGTPTFARLAPVSVTVPTIPMDETFGVPTFGAVIPAIIEVGSIPSTETFDTVVFEGLVDELVGSLITMAQADGYVMQYHGAEHPWFDATLSKKRIALRQATQYLLAAYRIRPEYLDPLHPNVIAAAAEAGIRALDGRLFDDVGSQHVESVTVGPISRKMSSPGNGGQRKFAVIDSLLRGLTSGGGSTVRLERA
jgi:hypothetical protein